MQTVDSVDLLALIGQDTVLTYMAATCGGEWAGACPFCGAGQDRLRVQPYAEGGGRWWCRRCAESDYWYHAIDYVRKRHGLRFQEACTFLQIEPPRRSIPRLPAPPSPVEPPSAIWQLATQTIAKQSQTALWSAAAPSPALRWLKQRGLTRKTIWEAGLGYNAEEQFIAPEEWGLPAEHKKLWLPVGITIPWQFDGVIWKLYIRRRLTDAQKAHGEKPYIQVAGCANALYNAQALMAHKPSILVEGVFDVLAIQQEASDLISPVATGTTGARRARWIAAIAHTPGALLGYDADAAGDKASQSWQAILQPYAFRWRPWWDDPAAMLQEGTDLRSWVSCGLDYMNQQLKERKTS